MEIKFKKPKTIIFSLLLFTVLMTVHDKGFSQGLSMSYYQSNLNKVGLAYQFSDRFWSEARIYTHPSFIDFNAELALFYNISDKERHRIYVGVGGAVEYHEGVIMPIGLQFEPIKEFDRFSLTIEVMPMLSDLEDFGLQNSWGLRYYFK